MRLSIKKILWSTWACHRPFVLGGRGEDYGCAVSAVMKRYEGAAPPMSHEPTHTHIAYSNNAARMYYI